MEELSYPEWQGPLLDAIVQHRSLAEIEAVIRERLRSLLHDVRGEEERDALTDALHVIGLVRQKA